MKYSIGIDAGGSKTECLLTDDALNIIKSIKGEGFNLTAHGIQKAYNIISKLIPELIRDTASPEEIVTIAIGAAGAGRAELKEALEKHLKENLIGFEQTKIKIFSDAEAAYASSFPEGNGFILIAGTGSIIFGKNKKGKYFRAGGYGKIVDEGCGYSLGRKAFIHASAVMDNFFEKDSLSSEILEGFKLSSKDDLIKLINNPEFNIADAAPYVLNAALANTPSALYIIDEETNELLKLIYSIQNQTNTLKLRLSLNGSLIINKNSYSDLLREKISEHFKEITLVEPKYPPAIGGIILSGKTE